MQRKHALNTPIEWHKTFLFQKEKKKVKPCGST